MAMLAALSGFASGVSLALYYGAPLINIPGRDWETA